MAWYPLLYVIPILLQLISHAEVRIYSLSFSLQGGGT